MIDLHGDLAGILTMANDKVSRVDAKDAKARKNLVPEAVYGLVEYMQGKLVAGARNQLDLLTRG